MDIHESPMEFWTFINCSIDQLLEQPLEVKEHFALFSVHFYGIPIIYMNKEVGIHLGNLIGEAEDVDVGFWRLFG